MLIEEIGVPAMLEQTAEEATELAFACLKLARHLRGENKVHGRTEEEMVHNLEEEFADIFVCYGELFNGDVISAHAINDIKAFKRKRMRKRLEEDNSDDHWLSDFWEALNKHYRF